LALLSVSPLIRPPTKQARRSIPNRDNCRGPTPVVRQSQPRGREDSLAVVAEATGSTRPRPDDGRSQVAGP
jgi:hypothetical protein